jgi:hypothetical protein
MGTAGLGHGLDVYGRVDVCGGFFLLVLVFIIGEFFFVPGVVAQGGVGDAAWVDYYLLRARFEGGAA